MATSAVPSESIPLLRSQLRGGGRVAIRDALDETKNKPNQVNRVRTTQQQQIRRLSFLEKGNLFEDHNNNNDKGCSCEKDSPDCECSQTSGEDSEDSGIGMGIVGATDIDKTAGGETETTANPAPGKDSQSHTIQSHPQQQHNNQHNHNNNDNQSSETNSDGGDAATPTTNDAEKYVDGLEVDRPDNSANTNTIVSSETEKSYDPEPEDGDPIFLFEDETHDDENEENDDETNSIPKKDIAIFTGLAAASLLLYAIYWRDNVLHERIEAVQKHQARIDRLKNLYDGLDKYSAHVLDGCSKGDVMGVPCVSKSRRSKLSRTRSNMPVDLDLGTIEPEDNTTTTTNHHSSDDDDDDDNEDASSSSSASSFGRERLPDDESLSRDDVIEPVLTVRRVRRTSGTNEHWIKYSSDEFEAMSSSLSSSDTESGESQSGSSTHNGSNNSNEDSIPQLS